MPNWPKTKMILLIALISAYGIIGCTCAHEEDGDWSEYNGSGHRNHYSHLQQINRENISTLSLAWVYESGGEDSIRNRSQIQCNPLVVNGVLYGLSADNQVFAVDASTGREIWKTNFSTGNDSRGRGLTMYGQSPNQRIFFGSGQWLYALHASSGEVIEDFGDQGRIDLAKGIERPGSDTNISMSSPATLFEELLIVGCRLSENVHAMVGDIRAYHAVTGDLVWTFKTIPEAGSPAASTWLVPDPRVAAGGANAWMGSAIDRERGIVYIPTGSAAYDFYGANRPGDNLYANCLLALDAETGEKIWHYQLVRHDIWDRDPPAPPNLYSIVQAGVRRDVVSLVTKQGHVFVLDRDSGKPVFSIVDSSFATEAMPGEYVSESQPIPLLPEPFTRQSFDTTDVNHWVGNRDSLIEIILASNTGSPYIPITEKRTIFFPGTDGGAQWGGAAVDPDGIMYVPAKEIPVYTSLVPRVTSASGGQKDGSFLYQLHCSSCHGRELEGNHDGSFPALTTIGENMKKENVLQVLEQGKGRMPKFSHLSDSVKNALVEFLFGNTTVVDQTLDLSMELPYQHTGYNRWYDVQGFPISTPPWGTLTAIDVNTGHRQWQVPLGSYPELLEKGIPITGTDNYGGPLVTGGDLLFIAAARDEKIRAFDTSTGQQVWEHDLPAAGYASPATYMKEGRQYIVIACGGGKLNTKSGSKYLAFALSRN